jgi:molybdopterin-binding protein
MTVATTKIRIRLGQVEIDYEGDAAFLDSKLMEMVKALQELLATQTDQPAPHQHGGHGHGSKSGSGGLRMSTKTIAMKLGAKKGADIARAAVAHLALVKGKETFTRAEIHEEMKAATGIYKASMFSNLSSILTSLISDNTLIDTGSEVYALTPEGDKALRSGIGAA